MERERVITLGSEVDSLRKQIREAEGGLVAMRERLVELELALDVLLGGGSPSAPEPHQGGSVMNEREELAIKASEEVAYSGSRMKHDIRIGGRVFRGLTLKSAMLEVVRQALAHGIHPRELKLQLGTPSFGTRWLHGVDRKAALHKTNDQSRWFVDNQFVVGGETWILSSQWSWEGPSGSSRDDLERIATTFPTLGLTWRRYR